MRRIEKSFAWIDHRLLRSGYLQVMTPQDQALYLCLVLAGDRYSASFYRKEKICDALGLDWGSFEVARDGLIDLKLIAFVPYTAGTPTVGCKPCFSHTSEIGTFFTGCSRKVAIFSAPVKFRRSLGIGQSSAWYTPIGATQTARLSNSD